MIIKPELLTHPNIPKPLHGTAPRTILGKEWWDEKRKEAYMENNYHCMACGAHKSQDRFHNWLEAHEDYEISYATGKVKLKKIVALCHSCHNFIHSGRLLSLWRKGEVSDVKISYILKRGFRILKTNNLEPFHGTCDVYCEVMDSLNNDVFHLFDRVQRLKIKQKVEIQQDWSKWHIEIDGVNHYGKFESIEDWKAEYSRN